MNKLFVGFVVLMTCLSAKATNLICTDEFDLKFAKVIVHAQSSDATKIENISIERKGSMTMSTDSIELKPYMEYGLDVLVGSKAADKFQIVTADGKAPQTDFHVIMTLGAKWLAGLQKGYGYVIGQIQFYCDDCGGDAFVPNMYCRSEK